MTLIEVTYELQAALTSEQLRKVADFANTYGMRRFHVDASGMRLSVEYDASRLKKTQVLHVLGSARIAVAREVAPVISEPALAQPRSPQK